MAMPVRTGPVPAPGRQRPSPALAWALLAAVALGGTALTAAERPDLSPNDFDTVIYKDGHSELCEIVDVKTDNSLVIRLADGKQHIVPAGDYGKTIARRTAVKVIKERIKWDMDPAHEDQDDVIKTVLWGYRDYPAKFKDNKDKEDLVNAAKEAAYGQALKAMEKWPNNTDLASKAVLPLYADKGDNKSIEELARRLVKSDPHWTEGYDYVAKVLEADPARSDELLTWLGDWVKFQPTAFRPNQALAKIHEASGSLRAAQEEFRKCYVMHKDLEAGLGYARTSLARGDADKALAAASDLLGNDKFADESKVIAGSAKLMLGDITGAQGLLEEALKGKLGDESAKIAHYNLGVVSLRAGKLDDARTQWAQLDLPVAKLATAILERKPFTEVETLKTPGLQELAKVLNACVDLEHGKSAAAVGLDARLSNRHLFLSQLAKLVLQGGNGADAIVADLKATPGLESQRWQVYALLLGKKYKEAEAAIAQLPENDPYGLAYRVCVAEGLNNRDQAKAWYQKLSPDAMRELPVLGEWSAKVHSFYQSGNDTIYDEKFNWPVGDLPNAGWQYSAPGTAIHIHTDGSQLLFDGTQSANPDAITRAWWMVQETRLRQAKVDLDLTNLGNASAGLEILDSQRLNGVALAVRSDSRLAWRVCANGTWAAWQPLALQIQGTKATLCIEYNLGRVMAFMADEELKKYNLGDGFANPPEQLCVSIFGTADPGVMWKIAATRMWIQQKPLTGPGAGTRRLGDP
jgi:tetratricopeptide (TPR) repeat protein